jgi:ABC-2 type transport system ATP-binding protein
MAMNGETAAATFRGASKSFGAQVAVRGLDLTLATGRVTSLLGPNGAGKTTAVRMLLGLTPPTMGEVRVFGADPRIPRSRARMGAMLQVGKVPESVRVREHVALFRSYYPAPLPTNEVMDAAGLRGLEGRLFGTLSGGERQRVLFALAICGNPDLLVLDEPTVALDVETRRTIWDRIRDLRTSGRAVLLTTHHLEEADALSDRVVVLARGAVVADGTPAEIKGRVATRRVRCLTKTPLAVARAIAGVESATLDGAVLELRTAVAESVVRELLARDATLSELAVTHGGLEDAFLAVTADPTTEIAA